MGDFQDAGVSILAVILDLDGTLLKTASHKDILKEFLKKYGRALNKEKEVKRLGMTQKKAAAATVKECGLSLSPDQFIKEIMPMCHSNCPRWLEAKSLPDADCLIKHLHKHGVPFALASNSWTANIDAKISHEQGWRELFSVILGNDQVKSGKPCPDIVGVQAAKAVVMKVVAVPSLQNEANKYSTADSVLHSLLECQPELWVSHHFKAV